MQLLAKRSYSSSPRLARFDVVAGNEIPTMFQIKIESIKTFHRVDLFHFSLSPIWYNYEHDMNIIEANVTW